MATIDSVVAAQTALGQQCLESGAGHITKALSDSSNFSVTGYAWSTIGIGNHTIPTVDEKTVGVDYQSLVSLPAMQNLSAINAIDALNLPSTYVINTDGLFMQNPPESTVGAFTTPAPTIDFSDIDRQLAGISVPVVEDIAMPSLSNIVIKPVPTVVVPTFNPVTQLETLDKPVNQQAYYSAEYERLRPELKRFIDDGVDGWIAKFAPNYHASLAKVEAKLNDIMDKGRMLREDYQAYLSAKSRADTETDYNSAIKGIDEDRKRAGFTSLPQSVSSAKQAAQLAKLAALSNQTISREIRLIEMETENVKWAITTSLSLRQNLMQYFMGYANVLAQANEQANGQARLYVDLYQQWYELSYKRASLLLDTLKTEAAIYETELKAALAVLEAYRAELDANKLTLEMDSQKLEFVGKQVALQLSKVQIYSALLGSVETRAKVISSKVELFGKEVEVHNSQLTGDKIRNEVYLAGLSGDEAKLKAQMAKLEAWEKTNDTLIRQKNSEIAIRNSDIEGNRLVLAKFSSDMDSYKAQLHATNQAFDNTLRGKLAEIDAYKASLSLKFESLRMAYERDKMLLGQDEFNAQQKTNGMRAQTDQLNQHYQFMGSLTNQIGNMYMGAATGAINAQVTAFTSAA